MREQATGEDSAGAAMSGMVMSLLAVHEKDPSHAAFLSALPSELQRHPAIAKRLRLDQTDVPEIMIQLVKRAVASGEIADAKDAGRVAEMFIACMMGLSQYAALNGRGRPVATAFAELLEGRLFTRVPVAAGGVRAAPRARATRDAQKPLQRPRRA